MSKELTVSEAVQRRIASKVYLEEPAPSEADLNLITEAGLWAPTASNIQNSTIIVLENKAFKKEVAENYFHDSNKIQVESSQVTFLFAGTTWSDDATMEQMLYDHSISHWGLEDEDRAHEIAKGTLDYYNTQSDFKPTLDIYSSTTQMAMMMLQASALGYDTNGMLGFNQQGLSDFLISEGILTPGQRVNVAFSMGHRDPGHQRNKLAHNRITKEKIVKIV